MVRRVSSGHLTSIARAALPTGLAYDGVGRSYVADHSAAQILEIPLSSGATTAMNISATDIAYGNNGNLYVADMTVVRRVSLFGTSAKVIAGGGSLAEGDDASAPRPASITRRALRSIPSGTSTSPITITTASGESGWTAPSTRSLELEPPEIRAMAGPPFSPR